MTRPTMTHEIAHAAAMDAGNRSARENGRTVWTAEDFNAAANEYGRLMPMEGADFNTDRDLQDHTQRSTR